MLLEITLCVHTHAFIVTLLVKRLLYTLWRFKGILDIKHMSGVRGVSTAVETEQPWKWTGFVESGTVHTSNVVCNHLQGWPLQTPCLGNSHINSAVLATRSSKKLFLMQACWFFLKADGKANITFKGHLSTCIHLEQYLKCYTFI